ncbi:MAG: FAD-dependent monooxygenase [Aeromonas sp.]
MQLEQADVVIVGGNLVGLTLALALADSALRVLVIDNAPAPCTLAELDAAARPPAARVSALNLASQQLLENLGVWPALAHRRSQTFSAIEAWEKDSFGALEFASSEIHAAHLGTLVENPRVQAALYAALSAASNVQLRFAGAVQDVNFSRQGALLQLAEQQFINAALVVAADGAHSWLRQQAAVPQLSWDYGQHAVTATVMTELPHGNVARQIFSPGGVLAFLPLWQPQLCSIVWSLSPALAATHVSCDDAQFNRALTAAFDARLGLCEVQGARLQHPLTARYSRDFVRERLVLIGDAAHTVHPLAGQGANLGLLDAAALAQTVQALAKAGQDIGLPAHLRSFERWRKAEAVQMLAAMEAIKQTFTPSALLPKALRGVGMQVLSRATPLKRDLLRYACGLAGDLPQLACPPARGR